MNPLTSHLPLQPRLPSSRGEPTWEIAELFPAQGDWSEEEYLALPTRRLIEFSEECLELLPMPTIFHQLIVKFLVKLLEAHVVLHDRGIVLFAPLPVQLWQGKYREPDVLFLRPERIRNVHGQPQGADLAMEVVSQGAENRDRDLHVKRAEYARAQITEYWIIDPHQRRITVLTLDGADYRTHGEFETGQQTTSVLLPGLTVDVDEVFAAGEATP